MLVEAPVSASFWVLQHLPEFRLSRTAVETSVWPSILVETQGMVSLLPVQLEALRGLSRRQIRSTTCVVVHTISALVAVRVLLTVSMCQVVMAAIQAQSRLVRELEERVRH